MDVSHMGKIFSIIYAKVNNAFVLANDQEDKLGVFQAEFSLLLTEMIGIVTKLWGQIGKPINP
jgi:hypothetical protein